MRLSDLLRAPVSDRDGTVIGDVVDVRFVQDGPLIDGWGAALRIEGLVISRRGVGSNLGYDRSGIRGPWLISAIVRRLHRHDHWATWDQVAESTAGRVVLRCPADELSPIPELPPS